jgi:hypothetical protein
MANEGKFRGGASIRPVGGAGRARAQAPNAESTSKKSGKLLRDLNADKENAVKSVRIVTAATTPYLVNEAEDDFIFADAIDGAITVRIHPGTLDRMKFLNVWKADASANVVTVEVVTPIGDIFFSGAGRLALFLNNAAASVALVRIGSGLTGWWTISSHGNVTF